jgi:hypothetical protein
VDWDLDDPDDMNLDQLRLVRDEIKSRIEVLVADFTRR